METIQRVAWLPSWFSLVTITEIQNYNLALLIIDRKLTKNFFWRFFPDMVINLRDLEGRHCAKSVQIWNFSWSVFSRIWTVFRCIYSLDLRIQSKYGKIRTRKNFTFGLFSRGEKDRNLCLPSDVFPFESGCLWCSNLVIKMLVQLMT